MKGYDPAEQPQLTQSGPRGESIGKIGTVSGWCIPEDAK